MSTILDTIRDCSLDMNARLQRTLLLVIAVALGAGTFVMSLGSNLTASHQIANGLAAGMLDQISVSVVASSIEETFPADAEARAMSLPLVEAASRRLQVNIETAAPNRFAVGNSQRWVESVNVVGVTSGYFDVLEVTSGTEGSWILDSDGYDNVAFVGESAAEALGIPTDAPHPSGFKISLAGEAIDVVGIFGSSPREEISNSILIPYSQALRLAGRDSDAVLMTRTVVGAGSPVSKVLREVVIPEAPSRLNVTQVATLDSLRSGVDNQLGQLGISVGAMLLVLTTLLIANSMIVSVLSRTAEIGLRRALGASKGDIARIFIFEGAITGILGGLAGAALGVLGNVVIARANGWSVVMPLWLPLVGLGIGLAVGVLASIYPALSGARISPATAIRID